VRRGRRAGHRANLSGAGMAVAVKIDVGERAMRVVVAVGCFHCL
jgi:hypothetical protein